MEFWEALLRDKLSMQIADAMYAIGDDPAYIPKEGERKFLAYTGRGGYIEYLIALKKEARKYIGDGSKI